MSKFTKRTLIVGAGGLLALGGLLGWNHYAPMIRFSSAIKTDARLTLSAGPEGIAETCNLCHGANGNPSSSYYPRLAGQSATYIYSQLNAFAAGERKAPQMESMALALSLAERKSIAVFYAKQPAVSPVQGRSEKRASTSLTETCGACHGSELQGGQAATQAGATVSAPRLAGLGALYLAKQLRAFKSGERKDPSGLMNTMAGSLDDKDVTVLSRSISMLPMPR